MKTLCILVVLMVLIGAAALYNHVREAEMEAQTQASLSAHQARIAHKIKARELGEQLTTDKRLREATIASLYGGKIDKSWPSIAYVYYGSEARYPLYSRDISIQSHHRLYESIRQVKDDNYEAKAVAEQAALAKADGYKHCQFEVVRISYDVWKWQPGKQATKMAGIHAAEKRAADAPPGLWDRFRYGPWAKWEQLWQPLHYATPPASTPTWFDDWCSVQNTSFVMAAVLAFELLILLAFYAWRAFGRTAHAVQTLVEHSAKP